MKNSLDNLPKPSDVLSPRWLARLRTGATLAVLAVVLLVGVSVGVSRVTDPFPQAEETPICTQVDLVAGDVVEPAQVTVSVLNAGGPNGLAGRTLSDLSDEGFGRGQLADAPKGTSRVVNAQIWTTDGPTAAVRLVRSYLRGKVRIVERPATTTGITVVVGEKFGDLKTGKAQFRARDDETTCAPTTPVETPVAEPTEG
ncbi:MAG: LytR C-terminal domain-containing protein [Nocardioides sp.]